MIVACLLKEKTIHKRERRGLLIGSGRILEPSMLRNNYTTEGKASTLLRHLLYFQNLQWALRAHRPLCLGSCRTFYGVLSYSCLLGIGGSSHLQLRYGWQSQPTLQCSRHRVLTAIFQHIYSSREIVGIATKRRD